MKLLAVISCVIICRCTIVFSESVEVKKTLYLLATAPYPDRMDSSWSGGFSLIAAVRLALKHINSRPEILEGYKLESIEDNSGCDVTPTSTISFFRNSLYSQKNIVGLVGPACSGPTLVLAPLLARKEISLIQIAPTATSPRIEAEEIAAQEPGNENRTTFTMIGSATRVIDSFIALMVHNGWTRVATLFDIDRDTFSAFNFKLQEQIGKRKQLKVVYTSHVLTGTNRDVFIPLEKIISERARVIFLLTRRLTALEILCLAHHRRMVYPLYQWVLSAETRIELETGLEELTLSYQGVEYHCMEDDLVTVLNGSILISYNLQTGDFERHTYTNLTYRQYRMLYLSELQKLLSEAQMNNTDNTNEALPSNGNWENTYYDATWAFAVALDQLSRKGLDLSQYGRGQPNVTEQFTKELFSVNFKGATGMVSFTRTKNIESDVVISQLWSTNRAIHRTIAAYYEKNKLQIVHANESHFISDVFINIPEYVHEGVGFTVIALAVLLSLLTGVLQIAFIAWSDRKWIKAASPDVNHLIFSGCYLFALAAILYSLQETSNFGLDTNGHFLYYSVICNVITWFLITGYTLIFGTAFIKIWRVYRLFKHFKNEKPSCMKDKVLITAVTILLLVDASFCITWNLTDPWLKTQTLSSQIPVEDKVFVTLSCHCTYMFYWIGAASAYKGTMAILLVVISTLNRKIQREHFRHTKKVNILVYCLTILYGVGFPLYFLLIGVSIYVSFLIMCAMMLGTVVLCCCMLFIPPIWNVIKTKFGKN